MLVALIVVIILGFLYVLLRKNSSIISNKDLDCKECNLIIISLTNTRKDHIGIYGYNRNTTPNIDYYFKDALVFENVFSPTPWTLPNGVSLFTSLFPYKHKVVNRFNEKREDINSIPEDKTMAELLGKNNYTTAAFTGGGDYNRIYGFDRGFDDYYDEIAFSGISNNVDLAIDWLEKNSKNKFFLFVQGFDTHCPFTSPDSYNELFDNSNSNLDASLCYWNFERNMTEKSGQYVVYKQGVKDKEPVSIILNEEDRQKLVAKYDSSIRYADNSLKRLFSTITDLKLDKKTIIVFLSEHGDLIGEHGRFMRTDIRGAFFDSVLNVPLLIKYPYIKKEKRINGLVNLVDIMPTLLSSLNISYNNKKLQGKDVRSAITNGRQINAYAFAQIRYSGSKDNPFFKDIYDIYMVRDLKNKLIHERVLDLEDGRLKKEVYYLYNIVEDKTESTNLFDGSHLYDRFNYIKDEMKVWEKIID